VAEPVTATAATTIQDVSILTRRRQNDDLFDLTLSAEGIAIQRPGRPVQHMSWDRVSEWEIEERKHDILLTLRGGGAATPLVVPGWSVNDLEVLMRELTAGSIAYVPEEPAFEEVAGEDESAAHVADEEEAEAVGAEAEEAQTVVGTARLAPEPHPEPPVDAPMHQTYEPVIPVVAEEAEAVEATDAEGSGPATRPARHKRRRRSPWKPVVTLFLLGVVATAVVLVLLQSAGIITWSFLGPTS
jgi:hypothetical protein